MPRPILRLFILAVALFMFAGVSGCNKAKSDSIRLTNQGMKALKGGDIRAARTRFQEAIDLYSDNANAHYGMGVVLREMDSAEKGARHLKEAVRLKPDFTEALYHLGAIALELEKLDEAEQYLRQVLELEPDHGSAHFHMGRIHEQKGALKDAEVALRRAAQLDPFNPGVFLVLARLYLRVDAEKEAIEVLREGIRLNTVDRVQNPGDLSLLHNELGVLLQQQGLYGQAIDELRSAVQLLGARPEVVFNLGWAYASKGDAEMALRYFGQYIGLVPGNERTATIALDVSRHLRERLNQQQGVDAGTR